MHRGQLYLLTDIDAPRSRHRRGGARARRRTARAWQAIVPEGAGTIDDFALLARSRSPCTPSRTCARASSLFDLQRQARCASSSCRRAARSRRSRRRRRATRSRSCASSFFYPPALFRYDARRDALERVTQVAHDIDLHGLTLSRARVRSEGRHRRSTCSFVHRGAADPRRQPARAALRLRRLRCRRCCPHFTRSALYWLERGGIYAVANLRGGGEFGEAWHRAGMLENKPRVFEDFEAVIRWFAQSGISRPERIAITGGSNGGLLVRRADHARARRLRARPRPTSASTTCCATRCSRRPSCGPASTATRSEPDGGALPATATRRTTSVRPGTRYPAVLIETAENDTRVS